MIAVDTNLLVYAHREDSPFHSAALEQLMVARYIELKGVSALGADLKARRVK